MAEMPERPFCAGGGTARRTGHERQASAAGDENTGTRKDVVIAVTMEEVLRAENVDKAWRRVKANDGAPACMCLLRADPFQTEYGDEDTNDVNENRFPVQDVFDSLLYSDAAEQGGNHSGAGDDYHAAMAGQNVAD